jgi:DNA invertase Pin-like site-specific DNA recombinase
MPAAYAYTRVSTTQQDTDGKTGLSRQLDTIKEFLTQHPHHTLSGKVYTDRASGFHGMNMKDDAGLGSFLKDCESGAVKAGDMLCVELIDRLSRLPPDDARELFRRILSYGVKVAIVRWGIIIDKTDNKLDLAGDLLLTVGFHLAYMESEQKSKRVFAAKQRNVKSARTDNKILFSGNSVPRWLELNETKTKFSVKPKEVALIERMFKMKLSGLGANKIMTILSSENSLMLGGKALRSDSITRLLKNRSLIGEWQPQHRTVIDGKRVCTNNGDPLLDYFPAVITQELFNATQASFDQSAKGMASRYFNNVFSGLLKCSHCGYGITQKISYSKGKVYRIYYSCTGNTHRKVCKRKSFHMNPVRDKLLQALSILDYSLLNDDQSMHATSLQRGALECKLQELDKGIKNLGFAIAGAEHEEYITDLMTLRNDKRKQQSDTNTELSRMNNAMTLGNADELHTAANVDLESEEVRIKLNHLLRQHIDKITVYPDQWCSISFKVGYMKVKRIIVNTDQNDTPFVHVITEDEEMELAKAYPDNKEEALIKTMQLNMKIAKQLRQGERVVNQHMAKLRP